MKHSEKQSKARPGVVLRFLRDQEGATLPELALVMPLFLLIFMGMIDFGRMAFHYVAAERAMNIASRVAAVRPPVCASVPETHVRPATVTGTPP